MELDATPADSSPSRTLAKPSNGRAGLERKPRGGKNSRERIECAQSRTRANSGAGPFGVLDENVMRRKTALLLEETHVERDCGGERRQIGGRGERDQCTTRAATEAEHSRRGVKAREARIVAECDNEVAFVLHEIGQVSSLAAEGDDFRQSPTCESITRNV